MTEVVAYALLCGFALSAVLVPGTAFALRRGVHLGGAARHTIWFMVLLASVAATVAAFAASAVRPAQQLSGAVVSPAAQAPAGVHAAGSPLTALGAAFLACWLIVSLAQLFRVARRITALRAVKHRATPIDFGGELPRGARALASESGVPAAVGFLHPAILLPRDTMRQLDPNDAQRIVLHEAAHLRRGDDLTGLVFLVCAALFWFNPFVHYIGKKLALECEIACDESVVERTGGAARYAALLFEMAENMVDRGSRPAWNAFAHRSGLVMRIHHLLLHRDARRSALPRPALVVLVAVLVSSAGLAALNAPALARPKDDASTRVYQTVRNDSVTRSTGKVYPAYGNQRVRDFPACKAHRARGVQHDRTVCEDPSMRTALPATRIKKNGATP